MGTEKLKEIVFVIGGCRSGKSKYALDMAEQMPGDKKIFIATCLPKDDEMKQRIARHQEQRSQTWTTVEEPVHLHESITKISQKTTVILVDCLTLWVTNIMLETGDENKIESHVSKLIHALATADGPVILVSNEVGTGIVPENKLARQFRDVMGQVNQAVAKTAGKVIWMVAGIPVTVKG
jgi:adenosylcobinamide kinase/adenosylcobinamide-phosphate guanylyltransferase